MLKADLLRENARLRESQAFMRDLIIAAVLDSGEWHVRVAYWKAIKPESFGGPIVSHTDPTTGNLVVRLSQADFNESKPPKIP